MRLNLLEYHWRSTPWCSTWVGIWLVTRVPLHFHTNRVRPDTRDGSGYLCHTPSVSRGLPLDVDNPCSSLLQSYTPLLINRRHTSKNRFSSSLINTSTNLRPHFTQVGHRPLECFSKRFIRESHFSRTS